MGNLGSRLTVDLCQTEGVHLFPIDFCTTENIGAVFPWRRKKNSLSFGEMEHSGIPGVRGNEGRGWGLERKMCLQKRWRNVANETTNRYWEYRELSPRNEHDLHQRQSKFKTRTDKEDLFPHKLKFTKHGILPNICTACLFCEILQFKITNLMKDCFVQITRECFFAY